jgi:hypothetical protein
MAGAATPDEGAEGGSAPPAVNGVTIQLRIAPSTLVSAVVVDAKHLDGLLDCQLFLLSRLDAGKRVVAHSVAGHGDKRAGRELGATARTPCDRLQLTQQCTRKSDVQVAEHR